jgi:hypothetical protein
MEQKLILFLFNVFFVVFFKKKKKKKKKKKLVIILHDATKNNFTRATA